MGPEYLAIAFTSVISAITGGTWIANKILSRSQERIQQIHLALQLQENKLSAFEHQVHRMPLEYVLKVDFLREIQEMHDNFKQINVKLDKLMEKLLTK